MLRDFVEILYFLLYMVGFLGFCALSFFFFVNIVVWFWGGLIWIAALILLGVLASQFEKRLNRKKPPRRFAQQY